MNLTPTRLVSLVVVMVGLGLITYSIARPEGDRGLSNWSAEQAQDKRAAARRLHELVLQTSSGNPSVEQMREVVAAHEEAQRLDREMQDAIDGARRRVTILRWVGVLLVAMGLPLMIRARRT